ncbi:RagB/SusD family nutrient uptake outer membrane protein [Echinicola soli]|uniref:RagB/SusD family nutrient uptake outer membrane protein n=2 Tax=Echinicola soli TaxID=2591634 RepID=A0A514CP96_9BACT|nr:RagB/SusD family nutrient uptake outer membrane protein [Echinicola soli]
MKKNNLYIIAILIISGLVGCEIHRSPELSITDDTYWKTENDLKLAANYFYRFLPGHNYDENWSDNSYGQSANNISDGSRSAPSSDSDYNNAYSLVRAANKLIEKSTELEGVLDDEAIERYQAEAYFFRAWAYFDLVKKYGNIQLVTKTLNDASPELYEPAVDRSVVFDLIYSDLDFAAEHLPSPEDISDADYGRVGNTTAWGLKARAALFEGTRAKFHNYGDASKHLTIARDASLKVIESGQHQLFQDYATMLRPEGEGPGNTENMLVRLYGISYDNRVSTHTFARNIEQHEVGPTISLVESYVMNDGLPIDKSPLYEKPNSSEDHFKNRDKRLHGTVFKKGDRFTTATPEYKTGSSQHGGFTFKKYFSYEDWDINSGILDRNIMRYGEILLIYAEATYELNSSISDDDLDKSINLLRDRAGIEKLSNGFVTSNGLDMRAEIRRERRVELAQEGFRYWDLIRWKTAEEIMPKEVLGNYFFEEYGEKDLMTNEDNLIILQSAERRTFNPEKHYLWPLPLNEIAKSEGALEQNPKW